MGDVISLAACRADRSRPSRRKDVAFFFELGHPLSYLAAERVERLLGAVDWIPVAPLAEPCLRTLAEAERRADALRIPLVWPERYALRTQRAHRAAAHAAELGRCAQFALAAGRLAFCGGYDLDDASILAEAAAAAGLTPEATLRAIEDSDWDEQPHATAAGLQRRGVLELPAIGIGPLWCPGEPAVEEAASVMSAIAAGSGAQGW